MNNIKIKYILLTSLVAFILGACEQEKSNGNGEMESTSTLAKLKISDNERYFMTEKGDPFFWMGDTGWLLFRKLNREEAVQYLEDRKEKGFNVIQVMMLHSVGATNAYGAKALLNDDVSTPILTEGNDPDNETEYDYWDHVDYIVEKAGEKGLYMAMVPVWGSNVRAGLVDQQQAASYAKFVAERYGHHNHVIWLNGGDVPGSDSTAVWQTMAKVLRENNPEHLITFHPRGRTQSSDWFHQEDWLDFNMIQSGHRRYDQDDSEKAYGEDNWRYVEVDYQLKPTKPTLDAEPSYEGIPEGLNDPSEPFWDDAAVRRYGYWSVFAGAAGYTYGHSALMQMYHPSDESSAYGNTTYWHEALDAPGAQQMIHLRKLMKSFPYFERVPDQRLIANQGERYDYLIGTRGRTYALIYTYTGRPIEVNMGIIEGKEVRVRWFNPRNGEYTEIGTFENQGTHIFTPNGNVQEGNDWVLVLN